jgi:hypothetical protein
LHPQYWRIGVPETRPFQPHKLIVPGLAGPECSPASLVSRIADLFGPIDSQYGPVPFTFTDYYDEELGVPVTRILCSIRGLVDPSALAGLKQRAIDAEAHCARPDGRRTINLDPGLLSLSRLILATTKASGHRIPLTDGIHAEITLLFRHGRYEPLPWTYPDFQSDPYQEWLLAVRGQYAAQLRDLDPSRAWRL